MWHAGDESEVPLPTPIPLHAGMTWREVRYAFAAKHAAPVPSVTLFFPGNTPIPLDQPASDHVRVDATLRACTASSILLAYDFIDVLCTTALSFFSEPTVPNLRLRQTQELVASGAASPAHHFARRLVRTEGWEALYRGSLVKVIPGAVFSVAKDLLAPAFASPAPSHAIAMLASELASLPLNRLLGTPLAPSPAAPRGFPPRGVPPSGATSPPTHLRRTPARVPFPPYGQSHRRRARRDEQAYARLLCACVALS